MQKARVEIVCDGTKERSHARTFVVYASVSEDDSKTIDFANMVSYPTYDSSNKTISQKTMGGGRPDYERGRIDLFCNNITKNASCRISFQLKDGSKARLKFDEVIRTLAGVAATLPSNKFIVSLSQIDAILREV
jgi:hypothetical protein